MSLNYFFSPGRRIHLVVIGMIRGQAGCSISWVKKARNPKSYLSARSYSIFSYTVRNCSQYPCGYGGRLCCKISKRKANNRSVIKWREAKFSTRLMLNEGYLSSKGVSAKYSIYSIQYTNSARFHQVDKIAVKWDYVAYTRTQTLILGFRPGSNVINTITISPADMCFGRQRLNIQSLVMISKHPMVPALW